MTLLGIYEIIMGNDVAKDIYCDVTMSIDIAICTYHGITKNNDIATNPFHCVLSALCQIMILLWVVWNKNNKFMFDQSWLENTFIVFV